MPAPTIRPTLQAFLFCRAVKRDDQGIASLERPFAKLLVVPDAALPVSHSFFVYQHWGKGQGDFVERFEITGPDGVSAISPPEMIHLTDEQDSYDLLIDCRVLVHELGSYQCSIFLDGNLAAERPLPIIARN